MRILSAALFAVILAGCGDVTNNQVKEGVVIDTESQANSDLEEIESVEKSDRPEKGGRRNESQELDDFIGITTGGTVQKDLFTVETTGVSTAGIQKAAEELLESLSTEESAKMAFEVDDNEWRQWSNVDNGVFSREGISIADMNDTQKELAYGLMKSSLSARGYALSRDIMKTDTTIGETLEDRDRYDEELYFFTLMGTPSQTEPWGWQLDGHHLVVNFFVLGDQVVMTPVFMGGEPIVTTTGEHTGNIIMQEKQDVALAFMKTLSKEQQERVIVTTEKTGNNTQTEAFKDNVQLAYEGINASEFSAEQKEDFLNVIDQYIGDMAEGHAAVKMDEIEMHIDDTWFSWVGSTSDDAIFYYRIHSPVVLIEFDHQGPVAFKTGDRSPTRDHIHAVVRTPNGNDYGKDILRQHLIENHSE